jgi:trans-aconitate methyltransferase
LEPDLPKVNAMKCLLCGSEQQKIFAQVESFGFPLVYYQCANCGLVFQSVEESRAADPVFYRRTYRKIYQSDEEPTEKDLWVQNQRADHFVEMLQKGVKDVPNRILDFGASAGVLLKKFQEKFGSEVIGVEPDDAYRAYAIKTGVKMYDSLDALLEVQNGKYNLVSLSHVLEHLKNPVKVLKTIKTDLLDQGGLLLIEVPNFYAHDSYELAHLACYTPHTLRQVLEQSGFDVILMEKHGIPRSKLLNLYLTVLATTSSDKLPQSQIRKDAFVVIRRKLSMLYRRFLQKLFPHKAWLPIPVIDHE